MNRSLATMVSLCAGLACSRTLAAPPQVYFWSKDAQRTSALPDGFAEMVRLPLNCRNINGSGVAEGAVPAANRYYNEMAALYGNGGLKAQSGSTPSSICIMLQNFGSTFRDDNGIFYEGPGALLQQNDAVDVDTDGDGLPNWQETQPDKFAVRKQPWMTSGRTSASSWMATFLTQFQANIAAGNPNLVPARFHFDNETSIADTDRNAVFLLSALPIENDRTSLRWNTESVPGYGTQTMAQLWASTNSTWTSQGTSGNLPWSSSTLPLVFSPGNDFTVRDVTSATKIYNQDLYLWYDTICRNALDAVMYEVAFDPINSAFPSALVSNYDSSRLSTGDVDLGWHQDDNLPDTTTQVPAVDGNWQRTNERGRRDPVSHGDHLQTLATSSQGKLRWRVINNRPVFGDFSAPELYTIGNINTWTSFVQRNPYLPGHPQERDVTQPLSSDPNAWEVTLRHHRWYMESIIKSYQDEGNHEPWTKISPWVAAPEVMIPNGDFYKNTVIDTALQLGLMRSKKVPELLVFDNFEDGTQDTLRHTSRQDFMKAYSAVYGPYLSDFTLSRGTFNHGGQQFIIPQIAERLDDTVSRWNGSQYADHTINVLSQRARMGPYSVDFAAQISGLPTSANGTGNTFRITLECSISSADVTATNCKIYLYQNTGTDPGWKALLPKDVSGDDSVFKFWPVNATGTSTNYDMRRRFDLTMTTLTPADFINSSGQMRVRVLLSSDATNSFEAKFDLLQVQMIPTTFVPPAAPTYQDELEPKIFGDSNGSSQGLMATADIDLSQNVDSDDVVLFTDAYSDSAPVADVNGDGVIDALDVADFVEAYSETAQP
jgi:hypothetical protein